MTKTIRTVKDAKGNTTYNAKDIFTAIGVSWTGKNALSALKTTQFSLVKAPMQVGSKVVSLKHYVVTEAGVEKLCKLHKTDNPTQVTTVKSTVEADSAKRIASLENTVASLKMVVGNMLAKEQTATVKQVDNKVKEAKVTEEITPSEARVQIRNLCVDYAKKLADDHGIAASRDRGIFYDLAFTILYTKFKQAKEIDIKALAAQSSKTGLQIAQDLGIVVDLLAFAKETLV